MGSKVNEVKISCGICILILFYSYVVCMWVIVQYVVFLLSALCLLLLVMF